MRVLSVTSEVYPLAKTGGLADVTGALPAALAAHDIAVRTLVPGYPSVLAGIAGAVVAAEYADLFGGTARLLAARRAGLDLFVIDAPHLYHRPGGLYGDAAGVDWPDNAFRFAALGWVAADLARGRLADWRPELVHAHDWQAALAPVYLRFVAAPTARPPTVLTIHNLAFQGVFPADLLPALRLPPNAFVIDGVEYWGRIGFLKGGIALADVVTTVSPTYADEIRTPAAGMGLDGALRALGDRLVGILNGIDDTAWNPAADPHLAATYDASAPERRHANRRAIEAELGLGPQADGPLFCVITRLTWQKGMDLLGDAVPGLVAAGGRLAMLGAGDAALEATFSDLVRAFPGRVGVRFGYDERVVHLLQGGADAVLVPSRFEPCGLTQLCGLRYGCVPVVARVGGLADTVIDANDAGLAADVATGVQFLPVTAEGLARAFERTFALWRRPETWRGLQTRGMAQDVSWKRSAARYAALYGDLVADRRMAA